MSREVYGSGVSVVFRSGFSTVKGGRMKGASVVDTEGRKVGSVSDEVVPDLNRALASLERSTETLCRLLREVSDPRATAVGYWTVGETATHLSHSFQVEAEMIAGKTKARLDSMELLDDFNQSRLREDPERDPAVAAERIEGLLEDFKTSAQATGDGPFTWHGGIQIPVATGAAIMISECLVHGYDIAKAEGKPWEVPTEDAIIVFEGLSPMLPYYVNRELADGFSAVYELSMRGGSKVMWMFDDGALTIEPPDGRRVDCRISADPSAYLLVGYGRISQVKPILTGKIVAYGRKPWLGMRLATLLANP